MKHCLSFVAVVVLAAGCKTDSTETSAGSAAPSAEPSASKGRSGKIDLPQRHQPGATMDGERPALPADGDGETEDDRRARRDEQRKERMAELDKDGDGQISDAEREAGRKERLAQMKTRLDANNDGKLTIAELQESRMARRLGDLTEIDTDKNGEISAEELQKSMDAMRAQGWGGRRRDRGPGGPGGDTTDGDPPSKP